MASPLPMGHGFFPHMPSPAGDIEYEKYFDFAAWERDQGDGVTRSSEGSIHTPAQIADSTMTPPSDHSGRFLDSYYGNGHLNSLPGVRRYDDDWTYPRQDPSQDAYIHDFSLMLNSSFSASSSSSSSSPSSSSSSSSSYSSSPPRYSSSPPSSASPPSYPPSPPALLPPSPKHSRKPTTASSASSSGSSSKSKKRYLQHPEQTAECDLRVCAQCKKFEYLCIHEQLSTIGPVFINIYDKAGESVRRDDLTGRIVYAPITFSETDPSAPTMQLCIQAYHPEKGGRPSGPNCAIPREHIPSWGSLARWAGQQILYESKTPFRKAVETFVMAYSDRPNSRDYHLPKFDLVDRVRKLTCMFKIWMTQHSSHSNGIYYRGSSKGSVMRLPYSVHEELRHIAKKAMESLERDILNELDGCMTQSRAVQPFEKPLLWVCLWQLISVYRQLLGSNLSHTGSQRCREVTKRLYTALVAYYTGFFYSPKSLNLALDLSRTRMPLEAKHELSVLFQDVLDNRLDFYQAIRSSTNEFDSLISSTIVENELKKLLKRRSRKPASSRGSKTVDIPDDGDDEDDDY
ncbi:hypothetical protein jhhlp_007276 [Lomentospora prolificans]|uniref:Uncharacterized protein n=1 Tax=Lomentospora prolificans TaxID=41688 RepID=A0A2N3N270_9PEZI|nr:hypothetical protein jhhlp_007276 [Lomentospora prolificans]